MKFDVTTNTNTTTPPPTSVDTTTVSGQATDQSPVVEQAPSPTGSNVSSVPYFAKTDSRRESVDSTATPTVITPPASPTTSTIEHVLSDTPVQESTTVDELDHNTPQPTPTLQNNELPKDRDGEFDSENKPPEIKRHHSGLANSHELDKKLSDVRNAEEELLTKKIANNWNMHYVDLSGVTIESDALVLVPQKIANTARATGFRVNNNSVSVALENPNNVEAQAVIRSLERQGYTVTPYMVSPRSMSKLMDRYADLRLTTKSHGGMIDMDASRIALISERVHTNADVRAIIDELLARPREQGITSELLEIIMGSAIATRSSDIHIESQEHSVRLRMRQDGVLEDVYELPHDINKSLASRIKILSGMKLTITKDAQDGRFTVHYNNTPRVLNMDEVQGSSEEHKETYDSVRRLSTAAADEEIHQIQKPIEIEIRVSTIPGPYGEGIVMRILDPRGLTVSFEHLGIEPKLMEVFAREIRKPEGIILTTGPTGSGKTTTLYSFLQTIYDPEIKVITIEDPIEYHLAGIQQTQVDHEKGYDFLSGLRAAMRQDPEVIMVGEIRDAETANTAIQAAQTGHLVLSTLHTNNAAGVIPRLLVLGVNPGMLASTLRMAIAQRLVRRLVPETKRARPASAAEHTMITNILGNAVAHGKDISRFGFAHNADTYTVYDATPTTESTGYHGRVGIFEVIVMDDEIEKLLEDNPSEREVREAAEHQGLLTMPEDAIIKILQGVTSFEEVLSVIDLESGLSDSLSLAGGGQEGVGIELLQNREDLNSTSIKFKTPLPNFHMDASQLETMWQYLKTLRAEQDIAPDDSRAEQIRDTETIILDIMKRNHGITNVTPQNTSALIQHEVQTLADELAELREHALKHPDPAIAAKLRQMHAIIDEL